MLILLYYNSVNLQINSDNFFNLLLSEYVTVRSRKFFFLAIAFVLLGFFVSEKITESFDQQLILFFQSSSGNPILDNLMWGFTEIGGLFPIMFFCFVMFIRKKTRRIGLIMLLAMIVGTVASGYIKDYVVDRPRPDLDFLGGELPMAVERDTSTLGGKGSFPSGHTTRASVIAFVMGFALSDRFPRGWYLVWIFPVCVALSRIYFLQHYPMDVFGGIAFGLIIAMLLSSRLKLPKIS